VVGAGVDHAVQPPPEIEIACFVEPGDVAQGAPAVGVGVFGNHGVAADRQLAAARRLTGHGPHAELDAVDRPAAAGGEGGVAGGDASVVVDAQHGQRPAALEPAVHLGQDRPDTLDGPDEIAHGDGGAAVQQPPQRRDDGPSGPFQGIG
jgi:hypothetical protein